MDWKPPYEWEKVSTIYIGIEYRTNTTNSMYIYIYFFIYRHTYIFVCTIYYFYKIELTMGHHIFLSQYIQKARGNIRRELLS